MTACNHADSGCNYPDGECAGVCMGTRRMRIDSTAFRRGVRAFKTGSINPYNGPELRDEWEAGFVYAEARSSGRSRESMKARCEAFIALYSPEVKPDMHATAKAKAFEALRSEDWPGAYVEGYKIGLNIAKATRSASHD